MTYLIFDSEGNMSDMIVFETDADVKAYQIANPDDILELAEDLDENLFFDDENAIDEW